MSWRNVPLDGILDDLLCGRLPGYRAIKREDNPLSLAEEIA